MDLCKCGCGQLVRSKRRGAEWVRGHWAKRPHVERRCAFPECPRKHYARGLCRAHWDQQRRGRDLHVVGDRAAASARASAAWAAMPADKRATRLAAMHSVHYTRTPEWRAQRSRLSREQWRRGIGYRDLPCACCGVLFTPKSGSNIYCSRPCRLLARVAKGYNLRPSELCRLKQRQGNACAICGRDAVLHVDHCHKTGRVRGLLCQTCNTGLGKFCEDPERLRRAVEYLTN